MDSRIVLSQLVKLNKNLFDADDDLRVDTINNNIVLKTV